MVIFFLSYCLLFNKITLNKGNVGTNHLNNRILLFVCNRKVIYYYYITLPSITITITITFGNFQSITITITITGKSGYYYYNYILHITITPSLVGWGHYFDQSVIGAAHRQFHFDSNTSVRYLRKVERFKWDPQVQLAT